ncbi:formate dehydrogenase accessory protein FdhE [Uliginosibacterium sp. 31-16]|uniref:formate dehydrogenase accessory protein FdhE n=1 Tax=Uliginosibacterium sp. 31-16 TaxID=3068315 RepID=UPI00273F4781|nr:formate dehydrogenase accessory protein FdhE [Uliginosibacterium sp. 31-16]MDP5239852.1 formate dehydrogenase accessory protein FdhE [Uliginosibacterium sp. 31-16]
MTPAHTPLSSALTPPAILAPATTLFSTRAARMRALASGHALGDWLAWLARLFEAQQNLAEQLPAFTLPIVSAPQMPLLAAHRATLLARAKEILPRLAQSFPSVAMPTGDELDARLAAGLSRAAAQPDTAPAEACDFIIAAALQVVWADAAHQALPGFRQPTAVPAAACPCCGSAPHASLVYAGEGKDGLRYLECSLCATRWNAIRARCTHCDTGEVVQYFGLEGGSEAVRAEACDTCHSYIKTFFPKHDSQIDPQADDLATLALDVLVGEQGYARSTPNLFLGAGEAVPA